MSLEKTEVSPIGESEKSAKEKPKTVVKVPVSCVVCVPIEIDYDFSEIEKEPSEELDCYVSDAMQNPDAVSLAVEGMIESNVATKAFDKLSSTAFRLKEEFPDVEICLTPFAGLIKEQRF